MILLTFSKDLDHSLTIFSTFTIQSKTEEFFSNNSGLDKHSE